MKIVINTSNGKIVKMLKKGTGRFKNGLNIGLIHWDVNANGDILCKTYDFMIPSKNTTTINWLEAFLSCEKIKDEVAREFYFAYQYVIKGKGDQYLIIDLKNIRNIWSEKPIVP